MLATALDPHVAPLTETIGLDGFAALRPAWDALFRADPQARFFSAWPWVRGLADAPRGDTWIALTLRDPRATEPFALLPFARRTVRYRGLTLERQLVLGGDLGDATGMLCRPGREAEAIEAFAVHLRERERWETLLAQDVADLRLRRVVDAVAGDASPLVTATPTPMPYIALPGTWDAYLATKISARRREDLRRCMRQVAGLPAFRCAPMTAETFERDFTEMMAQRHERWGGDLAEQSFRFRPLMRRLLDDGRLWMRMLRSGETLVASIGGFADPEHGTFWYYWGTFNAGYHKISPGKASFGIAIKAAIEAGFRTFSFTYGDEAYKATFGTDDVFCEDLTVQRPSLRASVVKGVFSAGSRVKRAVRGAR